MDTEHDELMRVQPNTIDDNNNLPKDILLSQFRNYISYLMNYFQYTVSRSPDHYRRVNLELIDSNYLMLIYKTSPYPSSGIDD